MAITPIYTNSCTTIYSNTWCNSGSFVVWQQAVVQPEPEPPRLTMDEIAQRNFHFGYWEIIPSDDRDDKRFRKLAKKGYRGVCMSEASPMETMVIEKWLQSYQRDEAVVVTDYYDCHERIGDYGSYSSFSRCIYAAPGPYAEVMTLLDGLPKRQLVMRVQEHLHEETLVMLSGVNYHIIRVSPSGHRERPIFFLSVEEGVDVALIKLFSGPDC